MNEWDDLTGDTVTVQTEQGLLTVLTDDQEISRALFLHKSYQYGMVKSILALLRKEGRLPDRGRGVVVDVGAHIGFISIGMLLDGEFERAVAVEPAPKNFELLEQNVKQNGLSDRFELYNCALSDRDGEEEFELSPGNAGDHRVRRATDAPLLGREDLRQTIKVEGRTIDGLDMQDVALVWMDVQGFDGYIFKGGSSLFSQDIPVVDEVWPYCIARAGQDIDEYVDIVEDFWSTFYVDEGKGCAKRPINDFRGFVMGLHDLEARFRDVVFLK